MAVYHADAPNFVRAALQSIKSQTLQASEVIVVQDGSISNELIAVIDEFKKLIPLVHLVINENNGLGWALKKGIEASSYDWVLRMDADDISLPERFAKQVNFIENNQGYDCIGGWQEEFNEVPGDLCRFRKVPESNDQILNAMKKYSAVNHVTLALKKSAVLAAGSYRGGIGFHEDYDLWNRMIATDCKFYNMQEILVNVRVGAGMLGRRGGWSYFKNECACHIEAYRLGVVSIYRLVWNLGIRFCIRLLPVQVRALCYKFVRFIINRPS